MKLLAVDPGGTTGWCTAQITPRGFLWLDFGQITGEHHNQLRSLMYIEMPDIIIYERFEKRNNDFSLLVSCEYIGTIKTFGQQYKKRLVSSSASAAKAFITNDKLQKLNALITPVTMMRHANDARRHMTTFVTTGKHTDILLLQARMVMLQKLK